MKKLFSIIFIILIGYNIYYYIDNITLLEAQTKENFTLLSSLFREKSQTQTEESLRNGNSYAEISM